MKRARDRIGLIAVLALLAGWLLLFFSGRGMLVWFMLPDQKVGMLRCHYFTGAELIERQYLYSTGFIGRESCPRFIVLE